MTIQTVIQLNWVWSVPLDYLQKFKKNAFTLAKNVSNKLGIKIGAAKFDMIITNDGPKIIEMTTRLSGGFDCQYVVPASTGKNVVMAAVMTACGINFPDFLLKNKFNKKYVLPVVIGLKMEE